MFNNVQYIREYDTTLHHHNFQVALISCRVAPYLQGMSWYVVIKTIKGRRYRYRQRTWRENGRVRCKSEYIGPVDGALKRESRGRSRGRANAIGVAGAVDKVVEAVAETVEQVGITILGELLQAPRDVISKALQFVPSLGSTVELAKITPPDEELTAPPAVETLPATTDISSQTEGEPEGSPDGSPE